MSARSKAPLKRPSAAILRGLRWIERTAEADFNEVRDERGTGHFIGTTTGEVIKALQWISDVLSGSEVRP